MSARQIVLLVVGGAVLGVALLGAAIFLLVHSGPVLLTQSDLLARPEGKLLYPGAQQVQLTGRDETEIGFDQPLDAAVIRTQATPDDIGMVIAWYDARLKSLGYAEEPPSPGKGAFWKRRTSYFALTYGPAVVGVTARAGSNLFVTGYTVQAGSRP